MRDKPNRSLGMACLVAAICLLPRGALPQEVKLDAEALSGLELRNIGPAIMSGRIVDIAVVESDPYIMYVASATGGVWKTTDNGVTFKPVFEREATHSIGDVAVHQQSPHIVWVGTGERANRQSSSWGDGVYKSIDGGESWTNMGLEDSHHIGRIALHPTEPDIVYVAAMGHLWGPNEERGLYKSVDGGQSWKRVLYIDELTGVVDIAIDPSDPNFLYAATYQRQRKAFGFHGGGPGSGLYRSTDAGETWSELMEGLPEDDKGRIGISIYRKDPRIVYICVEQGLRYTASISYEERLAGIYRSEDRGETWELMSDWNPRPMYASQILVDPNDDQRIYMMNRYSYSDDGGKSFTSPRQSVHGDDRILWVNPTDSRHVIKGSDGALALSYDRGLKWLFVSSLPVSQYYRVGIDMQKPFWVYGGLQDNGSWGGPSATYRSEGILNEDWIRIGGGDGFFSLVDPEDPTTVFTASQYLGLHRVDMKSLEKRNIRPDSKTGYISSRRNWDVWGTGKPFPTLGEQLTPANWDAPFIISPFDKNTLYAGTNQLWRSTDHGQSWTSLGDLTTGVDRSKLTIMGKTPDERTPSLDDGIPFYPTLTAVVESPLKQGLLYAGTDDGNFQVSRDGGKSWTNVSDRFPGLPRGTWVAGIEASRHEEAVAYAVFDGHRNDDYQNYIYKSTDYGRSWSSAVGDLPANRVIRAVHEDPKNANLIYVGTELGFFFSIDGGRHWVELQNNMPTLAVNDFVIHPRDNDLVLGTHGRGVWILDNLSSLQELTPQVLVAESHLFSIEPAEMIRYARVLAQPGDMVFRGENPPAGAIIDFYLRESIEETSIALTVLDTNGQEIQKLEPTTLRGINRSIWNLRYSSLPDPVGAEPDWTGEPPKGPKGPFVVPGNYTIRLTVSGKTHEQQVEVLEDPRIDAAPDVRRAWTETLIEIGANYTVANSLAVKVVDIEKKLEELENPPADTADEAEELHELTFELRRRLRMLYEDLSGWTGPPTRDQQAQMSYLSEATEQLGPRVRALEKVAPPASR